MTDERPAFQMGDISRADTSEPVVANIPHETRYRFERGDNMRDLYEQMRPDQRTALAGEFLRLLTLAGDDQADRFREDFLRQSQEIGRVEDGMLSASEVASIDDYLRERHPEMIGEMLRHPVTQSALKTPGIEAPDTQDEPLLGADMVMPTENVATSGAAYATSWAMMELGGEEANRMAEAPHEQAVTPGGESEREQRIFENEGDEGIHPSEEPPQRNP